ncbi:MAG TPA: Ran-binding zinc finger domain-containing protein [Longimicrobium sp.]|nr:Ran-binding zinc finger domain-containing protein [Longimicrobium sp.]
MAIREGRWDCPSCGSRGQLGRNLECAGCGAPRPQGVRFYLPGDEPPVTDAVRLAQARAGADWTCEHCGGSARATETECPGCGAPRGGSEARPVIDLDTGEVPHSSEDAKRAEAADRAADRARKAAAAAGTSSGPKPPPKPMTAKDWFLAGCTCCGGLGCLGFLFLLVLGMCAADDKPGQTGGATPRPVAAAPARDSGRVEYYNPFTRVIVTGRRWTRSVDVEVLRQVVERGQDPPGGAEILGHSREVVDHRRVFDHTEHHSREVSERVRTGSEEYVCGQRDLGNGYFEDRTCSRPVYETQTHTETESEPVYVDEPVYGTVYRYQVWRWLNDTTLTDVSHDLAPPRWPAVRERRTRREGGRAEKREVEVRAVASPARYTIEVDTLLYRRLLIGDTVRAVIEDGAMTRILPIWRGKPAAPGARPDSAAADSASRDTARGSTAHPGRSTSRPRRSTSRTRRPSSRRRSGASRG